MAPGLLANALRMLEHEVCVGNQALRGLRQTVADAARASEQLAHVASGHALKRRDPAADAVKVVQRTLITLGFSTGADGSARIDGRFGRGTERGVRQLQAEAGVRSTGVVDGPTLEALERSMNAWLAEVDRQEWLHQRDALDGTVDLRPADLRRLYGPVLQTTAEAAGIDEATLAAIVVVSSDGGADCLPRFEPRHFTALAQLQAAIGAVDLEAVGPTRVAELGARLARLPRRPGTGKVPTGALLHDISGGNHHGRVRRALVTVQGWSPRDLRELATAWGWGRIMGWQTLRASFRIAGITVAALRCQRPDLQMRFLGRAIGLEPPWRTAARSAEATGDYRPLAAALHGARRSASRAARMLRAAREYGKA